MTYIYLVEDIEQLFILGQNSCVKVTAEDHRGDHGWEKKIENILCGNKRCMP